MRTKLSVILSLLALVAVSCKVNQQTRVQSIPYVQDIVSGSDNPAAVILAESGTIGKSGAIVVIGSKETCAAYSRAFCQSDTHDNGAGKSLPDNLPDFAGETVTSIVDHCADLAAEWIELGGTERLRELAVRQVVSAIDTTYHLSPYDLEGLGHKTPAKMVIMTGLSYPAYGKSDVDTLLRATSCPIPVVSPFDITVSKVIDSVPKGISIAVGIVCDSLSLRTAALQDRFLASAAAAGISGAECFMFLNPDANTPLAAVLDSYIAAEGSRPLDALIVCNPDADCRKFESEITTLTSLMHPESITYGKFIAKGFTVFSLVDETMEYCYRLLRDGNLFTHDISYPQTSSFVTVDNPDETQNGIMVVPPTFYVQD